MGESIVSRFVIITNPLCWSNCNPSANSPATADEGFAKKIASTPPKN